MNKMCYTFFKYLLLSRSHAFKFLNLMDIHLNMPLYDEILQVIEESDLKRIPPP